MCTGKLSDICKGIIATGVLLGVQLLPASTAFAAETVTYLFPAPPSLPAFGPIRLAKGKGYFAEAGIDGVGVRKDFNLVWV